MALLKGRKGANYVRHKQYSNMLVKYYLSRVDIHGN